eukprot:1359953-Amphidinium_carterae.1
MDDAAEVLGQSVSTALGVSAATPHVPPPRRLAQLTKWEILGVGIVNHTRGFTCAAHAVRCQCRCVVILICSARPLPVPVRQSLVALEEEAALPEDDAIEATDLATMEDEHVKVCHMPSQSDNELGTPTPPKR